MMAHIAAAPSAQQNNELQQQVLVRFQDKTHVLHLPKLLLDTPTLLLQVWSNRTGWPASSLQVATWNLPFCEIKVRSSIRGGKGGFGTLLKGQSRQAGAKLTTDFGACRDLQGRRLRHVNDEIKLRKWREMEKRKQNGETVADDELWKTPSGLYNWHLMTPTWADISKKSTYKIKRQFQSIEREQKKLKDARRDKDQEMQNSIAHYVNQSNSAAESIQKSIPDAIRQGLESKKRKLLEQQQQEPSLLPFALQDQPNSLCTLSGDVIVVDETKQQSPLQIQAKSEFGTVCLVLDREIKDQTLYYEVKLLTGGLSQIGWASLLGDTPFAPNNDLGDGVGDDSSSFAFDGSRSLKFHAGTEDAYGQSWKVGDMLGCQYEAATGRISYSLNGKDLGVAFTTTPNRSLFPAISCNQGELLEVRARKEECDHLPDNAVPVQELLVESSSSDKAKTKAADSTPTESESSANGTDDDNDKEPPKKAGNSQAAAKPIAESKPPAKPVTPEEPVKPELLDLDKFSLEALEALGIDRLKSALMALRVKCG
jgi:hypothetical protein